jgi:hypothetical protein
MPALRPEGHPWLRVARAHYRRRDPEDAAHPYAACRRVHAHFAPDASKELRAVTRTITARVPDLHDSRDLCAGERAAHKLAHAHRYGRRREGPQGKYAAPRYRDSYRSEPGQCAAARCTGFTPMSFSAARISMMPPLKLPALQEVSAELRLARASIIFGA